MGTDVETSAVHFITRSRARETAVFSEPTEVRFSPTARFQHLIASPFNGPMNFFEKASSRSHKARVRLSRVDSRSRADDAPRSNQRRVRVRALARERDLLRLLRLDRGRGGERLRVSFLRRPPQRVLWRFERNFLNRSVDRSIGVAVELERDAG
jgi:hypothetical protein